MSATATAPVKQDFALHVVEHEEPRSSDGGRLTLGQKLDSVWEGLLAAGAAGCVVCGERMRRAGDAARCSGCGSTLT